MLNVLAIDVGPQYQAAPIVLNAALLGVMIRRHGAVVGVC